jgi:hypothetical protein
MMIAPSRLSAKPFIRDRVVPSHNMLTAALAAGQETVRTIDSMTTTAAIVGIDRRSNQLANANAAIVAAAVSSQVIRAVFRGNRSTIHPQAGARKSAGNAAMAAKVAKVV